MSLLRMWLALLENTSLPECCRNNRTTITVGPLELFYQALVRQRSSNYAVTLCATSLRHSCFSERHCQKLYSL